MRDFSRTPEPRGRRCRARGRIYVVQKHAARHLHYDFRLELGGVLLSWALPRGPSLDPSARRLAVQTEDHPIEYARFEGTIPPGQYGAGTVMVWDIGTWEPVGDPEEGYREGRLRFVLRGKKLRGEWQIIRAPYRDSRGQKSWLLVKARDEAARSEAAGSILDEQPDSALTGRTLEEIAASHERPPTGRGAG